MKKVWPLAGLSLVLTVNAWAGFDEGMAAYSGRDYSTALKEFSTESSKGNAAAQNALGVMNHNGRGVPQDYKEAVSWVWTRILLPDARPALLNINFGQI